MAYPTNPEEMRGMDWSWLAVDRVGELGFFTTAGGKLVPDVLFGVFQRHQEVLVTWYEDLEVESEAFDSMDSASDDWKQAAKRGFYAFDGDFFTAPYRLVETPNAPLHADELTPVGVGLLVSLDVQFESLEKLGPVLKPDLIRQAVLWDGLPFGATRSTN